MAASGVAAGAGALKQLARQVARQQVARGLRPFWKAIIVGALMLMFTPVGLIVLGFLAVGGAISNGAVITAYGGTWTAPGSMNCPVSGAVVTQDFGPTTVLLEPPGFGYPHFHTGIDLAAPLGTP